MWEKLALWALSKATLSIEGRNALVVHILDKTQALPLSDIIYTDSEGNLIVDGRPVDLDKMRQLKATAQAALDNPALKLIRQQVMHEAVVVGLMSKARTDLDMYFSRAAIWWGQQVESKLLLLAQRSPEPDGNQD